MNRVICQNTTCYEEKSENEDFRECFYLLDEKLSFSDAEMLCAANGDILPKLDQDPADGRLFDQLLNETEGSWLGLQRGYLCWSDEKKAKLMNGGSKCEDDNCDCVVLNDSVSWRKLSCAHDLPFVCEKELDECRHCAENANCINTFGSFECSCKNGYIGNGTLCIESKLDLNTININDTNEVELVLNTYTQILHNQDELNVTETIIKTIEDLSLAVGENLNNSQTEFVFDNEDIALRVERIQELLDDVLDAKYRILTPGAISIGFPTTYLDLDVQKTAPVVMGMVYDAPQQLNMSLNNEWFVNSQIVDGIMVPEPNITFEYPVKIHFPILNPQENTEMQCAFLAFPPNGTTHWATEGCNTTMTNSTHVECDCNHLTNFAVLTKVNPDKIPGDQEEPSNSAYIGYSVSIFGCLLTLMVYI